jgi:hypothetical protein
MTNLKRRARPEDGLEKIKQERASQITTRADELRYEHDFGKTDPVTAKRYQEELNDDGRENND